MGRYVQSQLLKDEQVEYEARIHWAIYLQAPLVFVLLLLFVRTGVMPIGYALLITALVFAYSYLQASCTELAVTNRRVIAKFGFIRRFTLDQQLSRVEGVTFDQSIFGRILGYATILVRGTGGGLTPIPMVDDPERFRAAVQQRL